MKIKTGLTLFLFLSLFVRAQKADSLILILKNIPESRKNNPEDTLECGILYYLARWNLVPKDLEVYTDRLKKETERKMGKLPAKHPLQKTLKKYLAFTYNELGLRNRDKGNVAVALDYFNAALRIFEELGLQSWIGTCYNNIANTYSDIGNLNDATNFMQKGLYILSKSGDHEEIAIGTLNLGYLFYLQNKHATALIYYSKGLKIATKTKDTYGEALALERIGQIYIKQTRYKEALVCLKKSLFICERYQYPKIKANSLNTIGVCYKLQKRYNLSLKYSKMALQLSKELNNAVRIRNAALNLKEVYEKLGKAKETFYMYELYIQMKDSVDNEITNKLALKKQIEFDYEKNKITKKQEQENLKKLLKQKQQYYLLLGIVSLVLITFTFYSLYFWYKFKEEKITKNLHLELKEKLRREVIDKELIANSIIHIQEQEREKLAKELSMGINRLLASAKDKLVISTKVDSETHLEAIKLLDTAIQEIRNIAGNQENLLTNKKKPERWNY